MGGRKAAIQQEDLAHRSPLTLVFPFFPVQFLAPHAHDDICAPSTQQHQQQASPSYYAAQPQVSLQDPSSSYHDPLDAYHHHPAAASTTSMSYLAPSQDDHGGYGSGRPSYSRDRLISNAQAMPMSELQPGQTIATPYAAGGGGGGSVYSNVSSYASTARAGAHGYPPPPQQQQMMGGNSPYAWQGGANLRGPVHGGGWGIAREQMLKRRVSFDR
jgi:hypothetical protein